MQGDATITNSKVAAAANRVPGAVAPAAVASVSDWAMKATEKKKYDQLFDSLNPANGVIPGNKVSIDFLIRWHLGFPRM